jgi:HSP20 family protein
MKSCYAMTLPGLRSTRPLWNVDRLIDNMFGGWPFATPTAERANGAAVWAPAVDIVEEDQKLVVKVDVPGVSPENIKVHVEDHTLTIEGHRESETLREEENGKQHYIERISGTFSRSIRLPEDANIEQIEAENKNGVLRIAIPYVPQAQPKQVEIKVQS